MNEWSSKTIVVPFSFASLTNFMTIPPSAVPRIIRWGQELLDCPNVVICRNCSASVECDAYQSIQTACRFGAGIECRSWAFLRLRFAGKSPKIGLGLDRG